MPHVKVNKFLQPEFLEKQENKKKKRASREGGQHADEAAPPQAAPPAELAAPDPHPKRAKKRARLEAAATVVEVETVVPAVPKPKAPPAAAATAAGSNWSRLRAALSAAVPSRPSGAPGRARGAAPSAGAVQAAVAAGAAAPGGAVATRVVAIDCEMVGVGPGGKESALARVCIVNASGTVLLDTHVKPRDKVTDYRTAVSGIRPSDLVGARPFEEVQLAVAALLRGRRLVGHALENDLQALLLAHPRRDLRDTARYPPLMREQSRTGRLKPRPLRHLAAEQLALQIQDGEHCPVVDARAALYLYLRHKKDWESWLTRRGGSRAKAPAPAGGAGRPGGAPAAAQTAAELARSDYMADL